ncbi:hypothetical protein FHX42_001249 [Saccharopolyspora lacisalsi]|uniref:Uncharacterized protein n=1 Tax=Halosaccharopolyspora lacisalsi TaxID=1000566 RepID=A0A839DSJ0_9PSEU|nr:hypothetical protein [Halosaccharopolyspora lacisalsi]
MLTMNASPPSRPRAGVPDHFWFGSDKYHHAATLRRTLEQLYQQPVSGTLWTTEVLSAVSEVSISEIQRAFDPGPDLVERKTYERLLYALETDEESRQVCLRIHALLSSQLQQRGAPPDDIAQITTAAEFQQALAKLAEQAGLSLRDLAMKMRGHDSAHAWARSALSAYVTGQKLPDQNKKEHLRTLLVVLCKATGRAPEDAEHYLDAWQGLHARPQHRVPGGNTSPLVQLGRDRQDRQLGPPPAEQDRPSPEPVSLTGIGLFLLIATAIMAGLLLLVGIVLSF